MKLNRKIWTETIKKIVFLIWEVENEYLESYIWGEMKRSRSLKDFNNTMNLWLEEAA